MPASISFWRSSGTPTALRNSAFSLATISLGVPMGTASACQAHASNPGIPDSATVGRSGSAAMRLSLATASALILPALICGAPAARSRNISGIWPPSRSWIAGPAPLYGTWVSCVSVRCLNISIARWCGLPGPGEA